MIVAENLGLVGHTELAGSRETKQPSTTMRILLQNPHNKLFVVRKDNWTPSAHLAQDFRHSQQALDFVRENNLRFVQLVMSFEDPQWDEAVPLPFVVATLEQQRSAA
jgi:hypothetical protein